MRLIKSFALVMFALLSSHVLACPGCAAALASDGPVVNPWGPAFNISIIFMLGTVMTIWGGLAIAVFRMSRAEERRSKQAAAADVR